MYTLVKSILFLFPAEKAHHLTTSALKFFCKIPLVPSLLKSLWTLEDKSLEREVFGLRFKNPVGLAAGFDKDGKYYKEMAHLGFGFIEIGTVTPEPQDGNPKPRLFRLPEDQSLINRMGFNNDGVDAMIDRLKDRKKDGILIGGNIGKNKWTPNEFAVDDYLICFKKLYKHVDYFVVNVSSPNTPNLRALQDKKPLTEILNTLMREREQYDLAKPILLKIAPDLNEAQLDDIVSIVDDTEIDGLIATNTTIDRSHLKTAEKTITEIGNGGLSGSAIVDKSTKVIKYLYQKSEGRFPIIGVGGISTAAQALDKINAGATLVQIYSGMIYQGPSLIKSINRALIDK